MSCPPWPEECSSGRFDVKTSWGVAHKFTNFQTYYLWVIKSHLSPMKEFSISVSLLRLLLLYKTLSLFNCLKLTCPRKVPGCVVPLNHMEKHPPTNHFVVHRNEEISKKVMGTLLYIWHCLAPLYMYVVYFVLHCLHIVNMIQKFNRLSCHAFKVYV